VIPNYFRPLPGIFRHGGFDFRVVKRVGWLVLVEKTKPNLPKPMYEVAVVRQLKARHWPDGRTTPDLETMPPDSAFGKEAWDFAYGRERAEAAFARMAREASTQAAGNDPDGGGGILTPPEHQNSTADVRQEREATFQPLPETWTDAGWRFRVLDRSGMVALLAKSRGGRDFFEVVVVQRQPARTWPSGRTTPAKEAMPSPEEWGTYGWSPYDLPAVEAKFAELASAGGAA
jgi:hypothetical protein